MLRVLLVEDDREIADLIAHGTAMAWPGSQTDIVTTGDEALALLEQGRPDLALLDITLPTSDGFDLCRRIRQISQVPILMVSARDSTLDKVRALNLGADDYLTKPFDLLELEARMRALIRRANTVQTPPTDARFVTEGLVIDFVARQVYLEAEPIRLTATEYRLLEVLAQHAGTVLSQQALADHVWGPGHVGADQYLKGFVRRLRRKLRDDARQPRYIHNEWGIGYRFAASA